MLSLNKIKLSDEALKFEKLRLETFKNVERYCRLADKTIKRARLKLALLNFTIVITIVLFSLLVVGIFRAFGIGNTNTHIVSFIALILIFVLPVEIWFYKFLHDDTVTSEDDEDIIDESDKSMEYIKNETNKLSPDSLMYKFYSYLLNILKSLTYNISRHDMVSKVTTGIYTMFIMNVFKIEKLPNESFSKLEEFIEKNTPDDYITLYHEAKAELREISENLRNKDIHDKLTEKDIEKIKSLGMIMTTDYILLKAIQYFCRNQCITVEELSNFLTVKGDENKDAYKFFYETPIKENDVIDISKFKL